MVFESVGRVFPVERNTDEAIGFFFGELEKYHYSCLDRLEKAAVPMPPSAEIASPLAVWTLPSTASVSRVEVVSKDFQVFRDSLSPADREVCDAWQIYRCDQQHRLESSRGEAGQCIRCGLHLGSAFLLNDLVCHLCFSSDDEVVEARELLASPSVSMPVAEKRNSGVHCRKRADRMSDASFEELGGYYSEHDILHDFESCCQCPVDRFTLRVDSCLSEIYRSDRDKRLQAKWFLAGLCQMCGKVPDALYCDSCQDVLAREYRDAIDEANRDFLYELYRENPTIFC